MQKAKDKLLVVGSVAYDDLEFHDGTKKPSMLGGAATHFSIAAAPLHEGTRMVGVVGRDFRRMDRRLLVEHGINTEGLEVRPDGTTFRWGGKYHKNTNHRDTLYTHLGVFENFEPKLPQGWEQTPFVFLANIHPRLQHDVLNQMQHVQFVAMDTMNLWIDKERDAVLRLLQRVNCIIISDQEAAALTDEHAILQMGRSMQQLGPQTVVIKRGEHGALLFHSREVFHVPGLPLEAVADPTGAGDSFAGGFMGMLAHYGEVTMSNLRRAMIAGSAMASYCVQGYGVEETCNRSIGHLMERYHSFTKLVRAPDFNPYEE